MEKYIYPSNEMLLTVITGNLCEGQIIGVKMSVLENKAEACSYLFSHNGQEYILPITQSFYKSEQDFKIGKAIEAHSCCDLLHALLGVHVYNTLWYYDQGKAVEYKWREQQLEWIVEPEYKVRLVSGFVPSELYYTQEDVYAWNDLIVHKDNGDIEIKEAPCKVLMLNDKQKVLFERFKALLAEMNEADMMIIEDRDNCDFMVCNRESYDISIEDCGEGYSPCFPKDMHFKWKNHTYYYSGNDEKITLSER